MISFTSIKKNDLAACHFELNDRQMNETKRNCFKHREVIAQWFRLRLPFCGPALGSNPKHTVSVFPICNIENGTAFDIGMKKDENYQKEAEIGPYLKNNQTVIYIFR